MKRPDHEDVKYNDEEYGYFHVVLYNTDIEKYCDYLEEKCRTLSKDLRQAKNTISDMSWNVPAAPDGSQGNT